MARNHQGTNRERSPYYGALQALVDSLFADEEEGESFATARETAPAGTPEAPAGDGASSGRDVYKRQSQGRIGKHKGRSEQETRHEHFDARNSQSPSPTY